MSIKRSLVLHSYNIKEDSSHNRVIFSIKFITKKGELIFLPKAVASGLGKMNLKENRYRGVQPVNADGSPSGHPYPVNIDLITEFNGQEVTL